MNIQEIQRVLNKKLDFSVLLIEEKNSDNVRVFKDSGVKFSKGSNLLPEKLEASADELLLDGLLKMLIKGE